MRIPVGHEITNFINHWVTLEGETEAERWADYWEKEPHVRNEATFTCRLRRSRRVR